MAKLTLTEEEKEAPTYLDWSDEALGKAVRMSALKLGDEYGSDSLALMSFAQVLASLADRANADVYTQKLGGVTHKDKPIGDWMIRIVRREYAPKPGSVNRCPRCGSDNIEIRDRLIQPPHINYWVECEKCGIRTQPYSDMDDAISDWNESQGEDE